MRFDFRGQSTATHGRVASDARKAHFSILTLVFPQSRSSNNVPVREWSESHNDLIKAAALHPCLLCLCMIVWRQSNEKTEAHRTDSVVIVVDSHDGRLLRNAMSSSLRNGVCRCAPWNPRQVATENIDCECQCHKDRSQPESPITMHTPPIGPWIRFPKSATVSFGIVLASSHFISIFQKCSPQDVASNPSQALSRTMRRRIHSELNIQPQSDC